MTVVAVAPFGRVPIVQVTWLVNIEHDPTDEVADKKTDPESTLSSKTTPVAVPGP